MSISSRLFYLGLGSLAVFCIHSIVSMTLEHVPPSWSDKVGYFMGSAFLLAISIITALWCYYYLFTAIDNYNNSEAEYYDIEMETFLKLPVRETNKDTISSPDELIIIEDKLADIPCEVFLVDGWYAGKIIRRIKLLTGGIDRESSKVYLIEIGQSPPLRQWLSAQVIRKQSGAGQEPRDWI
ncbi:MULTISPECIES: hypothetical protein [unclassified Microcoleus]|uniref:hypothetical protein n=1 Tax=unclassified Microcoleus TaxID=2642155 RepID=UPI002FD1AF72